MSSTTVSTQEELAAKLAAKLLAAEELVKKLQADLAKALERAEKYEGQFNSIKRRGCPDCEGDSDYEEECECT